MRVPVASLTKKLISSFFAATLAFGLVPSAAFAASDDLQSIPEGSEDAASIASSAEGGSDDVFSHCPSDAASSADGGSVAASSEDVSNNESISQDVALDTVVAQAETTKSFFLAQTLESTRTIPMVSARLPMDVSQDAPEAEKSDGVNHGEVSSASTVVGSFEYLGMTFAIESDGASVALVAADYSKLPQEFIEKQVVVIPESATPDGIDYYSVTRIADHAFAGFTKENANPDYVGCEALFSDEELLAEAGIDQSEVAGFLSTDSDFDNDVISSGVRETDTVEKSASIELSGDEASTDSREDVPTIVSSVVELTSDGQEELSSRIRTIISMDGSVATLDDGSTYTFTNPLAGCTGILALGIPASVTTIEDDAFAGFETLQYIVVSEDNPNYASYDGVLYCANFTQLRFISEGRSGVVRIAPNATQIESEMLSHCPSIDIAITAPDADMCWVPVLQKSRQRFISDIPIVLLDPLSLTTEDAFCVHNAFAFYSSKGAASTLSPGFSSMTGRLSSAATSYKLTSQIAITGSAGRYKHATSDNGYGYCAPGLTHAYPSQTWISSPWTIAAGTEFWECGLGYVVFSYNRQEHWNIREVNGQPVSGNGVTGLLDALDPKYDVTWNEKGATDWRDPSLDRASEVQLLSIASPLRTGYRFDGWKPDPVASVEGATDSSLYTTETVTLKGDVTFVAQWTPISYSVILNAKEGSVGSTNVPREYDDGVALPTPSAPPGFTFSKWTTNSDGSGTSYEGGSTANLTATDGDTIKLYAQYTGNPITLTFDPHDGSAAVTDTQTCGQPLSLPSVSPRIGWDFQGWFTAAEGGTQVTSVDKVPAEPTTYHARWKQHGYSVVFEVGDGEFDVSWSQPSGTFAYVDGTITAPSKDRITRRGYTLAGWLTSQSPANADTVVTGAGSIAEGGTTNVASLYAGSSSIPPEIRLYPVWSVNAYTVTIAPDDGAYDDTALRAALAKDPSGKANLTNDVATYTVLTPAFTIPSAKRTGWSFGGWRKAGESSTNPSVSIDPVVTLENATYTALWSKNAYLVKYYEDEGKDKEAAFASGTSVVSSFDVDGPTSMVLPTPSRTGWDFLGWSGPGIASDGKTVDLKALITDDLPTSPAVALVYTASWERGAYTVTYILNDGDDNYLGSFASGYKGFNGTAPARQDARTYIDAYRFDESGTAAVLQLPNKTTGGFDLTRPGYVFSGWVKEGTEVPVTQIDPNIQAEDIVLEARWAPIPSLAVPIATTPETVDVVIDRATGKSQEDIEGAPKSLKVHSTTPVDCTLLLRSGKGDADLKDLFETGEGAPASALDDIASSLGLLLSFDGTGLASTPPAPVGFLPDAGSGPVTVVRMQGSERYAADSPHDLCSVDVGAALKLAQRQADGTFGDLAIDLSKVRIKDISDPVRFANLVWTVSL